MEEFDFVARDQFGVVKFLTVLSIFILASVLQYKFPHQNSCGAVLKNWRVNLSLAGVNAQVMASVCGGCLCALALYVKQQHLGLFDLMGLSYWGQIASTSFYWIWSRILSTDFTTRTNGCGPYMPSITRT